MGGFVVGTDPQAVTTSAIAATAVNFTTAQITIFIDFIFLREVRRRTMKVAGRNILIRSQSCGRTNLLLCPVPPYLRQ